MAQILVRSTVTAEGYCAGWVGYVDDADPVVQDLLAAGYLTTDAALPPPFIDPCCLPDGGVTGQVLVKESNLDRDATWATVPGLGPAGGVLAGSYPDPTFAVDMATQAELDAAIATAGMPTPESLGAAGDGVRDDWAEVQAAFDLGVPILLKGTYQVSKPIEYVKRTTVVYCMGPSVAIRCHSSWSGDQLIRNWRAADWTGGETDHRVAPVSHTYTISAPASHNYYPRIVGNQLVLDPMGKTNLALFSWATPNETSWVQGLRLKGGAATDIDAGIWGLDLQGNVNGFVAYDIVLYGFGFNRQISINCQGGSGADVYLNEITFSPGKCFHSRLYVNNCDDVVLRDWHMESKIDPSSTAFIWLYSHTGFGSWTLDNGDFTINDGGTTTKPIVKVTSQTSDHTNMSAPQIRRLKIHKYTGTFNGNVVEDFWQTVPRNGTFQGKTITDMTLLHYYDGNIVSWANSNAVQDLYQRGGPPPSPFLQATYGPSITFDMSVAEMYYINVTDNNAFTINAPTNPVTGQSLYVFIKNQTTAMGAVTWNAAFKMAGAWANPSATGRFRTIHFKYQGGAWYEFGRSPVDVL